MSDLDDLYREVVLEHHRHPHGQAPLARADAEAEGSNPSCGDEVTVRLAFEGGRIAAVQVASRGCAISTAAGSMLAARLEGATPAEARLVVASFRELLAGYDRCDDDLGDLAALAGVRRFPLRVKCALLPLTTLEQALGSRR